MAIQDGALKLRIGLGDGSYAWGLVKAGHPNLSALVERVHASFPYNVELSLREGKVYAHITWTKEPIPVVVTKENVSSPLT